MGLRPRQQIWLMVIIVFIISAWNLLGVELALASDAPALPEECRGEHRKKQSKWTTPTKRIFVNVQIDKSGSSTLREVFQNVAKIKGDDYYCFINEGGPGASVSLKFRKNQTRAERCPDPVDGAVLQGDLGDCTMYAGRGFDCKYIIMMRYPLDRMVSEYNYFCRDCREWKKYCGRLWKPASCPKIAFLDYLSRYGDLYTRMFASLSMRGPLMEGKWTNQGFRNQPKAEDLRQALFNVEESIILPLRMEDGKWARKLACIIGDATGIDLSGDVQANVNRRPKLDIETTLIEQGRELLYYDTMLYDELFPVHLSV